MPKVHINPLLQKFLTFFFIIFYYVFFIFFSWLSFLYCDKIILRPKKYIEINGVHGIIFFLYFNFAIAIAWNINSFSANWVYQQPKDCTQHKHCINESFIVWEEGKGDMASRQSQGKCGGIFCFCSSLLRVLLVTLLGVFSRCLK